MPQRQPSFFAFVELNRIDQFSVLSTQAAASCGGVRFSLRLFCAPVCALSIAKAFRLTRVSRGHVFQGVQFRRTLR